MKFKNLVEGHLSKDILDKVFTSVDQQMANIKKPGYKIKSLEQKRADTAKLLAKHQKEIEDGKKEFANRPGVKKKEWGYQSRNVTYYVGTTDFTAVVMYDSRYDTSYNNNNKYEVTISENGETLFTRTMDEGDALKFAYRVAKERYNKDEPLTVREVVKVFKSLQNFY